MFDKIFKKIKGFYFTFLTFLAAGFGIFIGLFLHLPVDPSYSILSNYISDISAGPISAKIVFGIGMVLSGLFLIFLIIYITVDLQQKEENKNINRIYLITGIIGGLGLILNGIFPLDPATIFAYEMHRITGIIFFGFTAINLLCFGYIEYKNTEFSKILSIISLITGIISGFFIIGFIIQEYSPIPHQAFVYFTEWGFFGFMTIWLIAHGLYYWKKGK